MFSVASADTRFTDSLLSAPSLPCQDGDSDLFFSERPAELARAQEACRGCPLRQQCFDAALERGEPWGVWGGEIFVDGRVVAVKRGRGRPRKDQAA